MSDDEQLIVELINRARANPEAEAVRLGIGLNDNLSAGTISSTPKPPLAPNQALTFAAELHSQDMVDRDFFSHVNPEGKSVGDRIAAAGYRSAVRWGENLGLNNSASAIHDALVRSAPHRRNLMDAAFREIGVGVRGLGSDTHGTENFGTRNGDTYLTGVAFRDNVVGDDFYTPGEGLANVTITATPVGGTTGTSTVTGRSGGYSLALPAGIYDIVASGGNLGRPMTRRVAIGVENVKSDFVVPRILPGTAAPALASDRAWTIPGASVPIPLLANDSGDRLQLDPSSVELLNGPAHGSAQGDPTTGVVTYQPEPGYVGADHFRYRVADLNGKFGDWTTVYLTVVDPAAAQPWRNPVEPLDVDGDSAIAPTDVLSIINALNLSGGRQLPNVTTSEFPTPYLDVDGDGYIAPIDALLIINRLSSDVGGEGEFEVEVGGRDGDGQFARSTEAPQGLNSATASEQVGRRTSELLRISSPASVDNVISRELWTDGAAAAKSDMAADESAADDVLLQDRDVYFRRHFNRKNLPSV